MTNLARAKVYETGKILITEDKSDVFRKQVATIKNHYINLKIVNAMVEDNFYINIVDNEIKQSYIQKLKNKNQHLQIRIILKGTLEKLDHQTNQKEVFHKNEISIEYKHSIEESLLNKQGEHLKYICITINEEYLNKNKFLSEIFKKNSTTKLQELNLKNRFEELFNREYSSGIDQIYLKNKTSEIMLYVIEEIQKQKNNLYKGLYEDEIERIKKAEFIIQNFYHEKLTIPQLAKKVALNQSKLKTGFKQVFKQTIYEYLKDIRLEKAVTFLKENKYSVKEVANMVGYTNQGSFSYAFSNKYKCSPKEIRKNSNL